MGAEIPRDSALPIAAHDPRGTRGPQPPRYRAAQRSRLVRPQALAQASHRRTRARTHFARSRECGRYSSGLSRRRDTGLPMSCGRTDGRNRTGPRPTGYREGRVDPDHVRCETSLSEELNSGLFQAWISHWNPPAPLTPCRSGAARFPPSPGAAVRPTPLTEPSRH